MSDKIKLTTSPAILAPAGDRESFLAAIAAGADAVYCGLKQFSARMEANNFTMDELNRLTRLAHERGVKVCVAINSILKPGDIEEAGRLLDQLNRWVKPDALIIQDLALVQLTRQTGFSGELHLSTLANVGFSNSLKVLQEDIGVDYVVLPRELDIDEIKALAQACPNNLSLEVFVHGALCYGVSGRCYWSSFLGGKSGLRGRCVQPCRRVYTHKGQKLRCFSCQDLSLDVLVKLLLQIPNVRTWKIEGRKKGPHYVFYTAKAYRILRDHGSDPEMKKTALYLLSQALARTGTHYRFLPQRPQNPVRSDGQTASGRFVGKIGGSKEKPHLVPREELLPGDILRLGYEDQSWHAVTKVKKYVPKKGRMVLNLSFKNGSRKGAPVFLLDRREKQLEKVLTELEREFFDIPTSPVPISTFHARLPKKSKKRSLAHELFVYWKLDRESRKGEFGLWISEETPLQIPRGNLSRVWWWLPPAIWPHSEVTIQSTIEMILKRGGRNFVLNSPWQISFFRIPKSLNLWAGPFCNITNALAINTMGSLGFSGVIVSPELGRDDYFSLPKLSPLPLGIVVSGNWPLCISRTLSENLKTETPFISPRGEQAWVKKNGSDFWVYPNWKLDIRDKKDALQVAGYSLFVHLIESIPKSVKLKRRSGYWNWDIDLL